MVLVLALSAPMIGLSIHDMSGTEKQHLALLRRIYTDDFNKVIDQKTRQELKDLRIQMQVQTLMLPTFGILALGGAGRLLRAAK